MAAPANWYPDPGNQSQLRYWDGVQWTNHTQPLVQPQPQPLPVQQPAPFTPPPLLPPQQQQTPPPLQPAQHQQASDPTGKKKMPLGAKIAIIVVSALVGSYGLMVGAIFALESIADSINPGYNPEKATFQESLEYYDEVVRPPAVAFLENHYFGYDYQYLQETIEEADRVIDPLRNDPNAKTEDVYEVIWEVERTTGYSEKYYAEWDEKFNSPNPGVGNETGTEAESALDVVSRDTVRMVRGDCGDDSEDSVILACVITGTNEVIVPDHLWNKTNEEMIATYGNTWSAIMLHEYAHVFQNRHQYRMTYHPDYIRLFVDEVPSFDVYIGLDWDREHSAECMALYRDPEYVQSYRFVCTPEQIAFGGRIWEGDF